MRFYLKMDTIPNYWVLISDSGSIISGPKYFSNKNKAIDWARVFCSSWSGVNLIIEDK